VTRIVITGGTVVDAAESYRAAVLVEGERIVALSPDDSDLTRAFSVGADVVDASGKYVLPGGIDAHTHFEAGVGELKVPDTFSTGTVAAALGGTSQRPMRAAGSALQSRGITRRRTAGAPSTTDSTYRPATSMTRR